MIATSSASVKTASGKPGAGGLLDEAVGVADGVPSDGVVLGVPPPDEHPATVNRANRAATAPPSQRLPGVPALNLPPVSTPRTDIIGLLSQKPRL
ncbi:hypothetical protein [Arthrobacter oryzae]|uniref:hypothetical protein n=1 Tax=Arthrobacter oryzae TaxID=409290 RepID=UPI0030C934E8